MMSRKVIFLDIDGVLNPTHYMNALYKMYKASNMQIKSHDEFGQLFFYQNVNALEKIVNETGAKIVISSTWRMDGISQMIALWEHRSLPREIIGVTPILDSSYRGDEILAWINNSNFTGNYVIIDDTDSMLDNQKLLFVKTNPFVGLTLKNADLAINILNKTT